MKMETNETKDDHARSQVERDQCQRSTLHPAKHDPYIGHESHGYSPDQSPSSVPQRLFLLAPPASRTEHASTRPLRTRACTSPLVASVPGGGRTGLGGLGLQVDRSVLAFPVRTHAPTRARGSARRAETNT